MNNEFISTVTISLKEYEELRANELLYKNLPKVKECMRKIVSFEWGYGRREDFNANLYKINELLNENIWGNDSK